MCPPIPPIPPSRAGSAAASPEEGQDPRPLRGSCLCGAIRYEIEGPLGPIVHCHCSMCRKATGAAFRSRAAVPVSAFRFLTGEASLVRYRSSTTDERTFCGRCGATLVTLFPERPEVLGLALGTLDDDPGSRPVAHVYVSSSAPWFVITDDLPRFAEGPPPHGFEG